MGEIAARWIDVDWSSFDPWRVQGPLRHRLMEHPLLQWDQLLELGKRLDPLGQFRTHSNQAQAGTPFNDAPRMFRNRKSAVETIESLSDANAWMSLLNVQTDPLYRTLVDEVLDQIKPGMDRVDPGMCYRAGWIFMASPHTITPFHFDTEHSFIVQLEGHKTLYVWDPQDLEAASEHARDRFHAYHDRKLLIWREELRQRAHVFRLEPGVGAYMPCTSPHLVENDDERSLTMSFTFYTDSTRRSRALHKLHAALRNLGITPPAVGENRLLDAVGHALYRCKDASELTLRRLTGRKTHPENAPHAFADAI